MGLDELRAAELWLWTQIAGTTEDVATLMANSKCLEGCVRFGNSEAIIVSLLAQIAGVSDDPQTLISNAACFESCFTLAQAKAIDVYLLAQLAGVSADPASLAAESYCFRQCVTQWQGVAIKIWLIATEAGVDPDPQTLLSRANCLLGCLTSDQLKLIETWLICQIPTTPPIPPIEDPEDIANLIAWWRADDLTGVVADGGLVGAVGQQWIDRVSANKGSQPSASLHHKPTFIASGINLLPTVRFNLDAGFPNQSSALILDSSLVLNADFTAICVQQYLANSATSSFGFLKGLSAYLGSSIAAGPAYQARISNDAGPELAFASFAVAATVAHSLTLRRTTMGANNVIARLNNSDEQVVTKAGTLTCTQLNSTAVTGQNITLNCSEIILYNSSVSDSDLVALYNNYLKPRYALP